MLELDYGFVKVLGEYKHMYSEFPLPVMLCDRQLHVHWSNDAAKLGYAHLTLPGGIQNLLAELDTQALLEGLQAKGSVSIADLLPLADIRVSLLPMLLEEQVEGVVVLLINETSLDKDMGANIFAHTVSSLSNSVRSAMDALYSSLDAASLKATLLDAPWMEPHFSAISINAYRILRVVSNISQYAKLQNGALNLRYQSVNLFAWVREIRETLESLGGQLEIPINVSVPEEDAWVRLDKDLFEQAFFNVLHNAVTYTRPGNQVDISCSLADGLVSLTVRDRGAGIKEEHLESVFRPYVFFSGERNHTGTGLGLTLAQKILEAHDGCLALHSRPGQGTAVTLSLPVASFSASLPMGQRDSSYTVQDRFSPLYVGLVGALGDTSP